MAELEKVKKKNYNLSVKLLAQQNGINIEVSTWCADWDLMQKFLNDFQNILNKGKNGKNP